MWAEKEPLHSHLLLSHWTSQQIVDEYILMTAGELSKRPRGVAIWHCKHDNAGNFFDTTDWMYW